MAVPIIQSLEKMLANGKDSSLLRFSLGNEYLKQGDPVNARMHLKQAVILDPLYSAAWKALGKSLETADELEQALQAYHQGIEVAEKKGDKQAAKEMAVFAKRIEKQISPSS